MCFWMCFILFVFARDWERPQPPSVFRLVGGIPFGAVVFALREVQRSQLPTCGQQGTSHLWRFAAVKKRGKVLDDPWLRSWKYRDLCWYSSWFGATWILKKQEHHHQTWERSGIWPWKSWSSWWPSERIEPAKLINSEKRIKSGISRIPLEIWLITEVVDCEY